MEDDLSESNKTWQIPVCYDLKFAIDLENFAKEKKVRISTRNNKNRKTEISKKQFQKMKKEKTIKPISK